MGSKFPQPPPSGGKCPKPSPPPPKPAQSTAAEVDQLCDELANAALRALGCWDVRFRSSDYYVPSGVIRKCLASAFRDVINHRR